MLTTLLSFAFVLGLLIFVHEFGHFITAKMVGIRVERFSLGFPPRMIGKKIGDTDYCISWLPLGGYVKMAGMIDENLDANIKGEPYEFASKPVWQRSIVLSAGSVMNILTAIVIFTALTLANGVPRPEGALISEVIQGKPADVIGLKAGDVITSIDDQPIKTSEELTSIIHKHPGQQVTITWLRDGQEFHSPVVPEPQPETHIGLIGIRVGTKMHYEKAGLAESLSFGVSNSFTILKLTVQSLKLIITGQESFRDAVGGPIIIAKLAGESARLGFQSLLTFTAIISLNLGFFNLLPFPVLDGGHLVLLLLEGIRRKPIPVKTRLVIQKVGMAFLLALMVFILIND
ncbi:MAG: RIP metalloprotease RseP, partial [Calditrichaeota bacterium]